MYLLNGKLSDSIPISDRGFQYGDGLFETLEVWQGRPLFLNLHLQRLEIGCKKLVLPAPDLALLTAEAFQLCHQTEHGVLKIIITRGSGGRGYRQPESIQTSRLLGLFPYPDHPAHYQTDGINLRICQQRLALNPALAGIKHLNRLEQILARAEWHDEQWQEGLMLDYQNRVIEGTMSNIFRIAGQQLLTPSLHESGISGIVRGLICQLANSLDLAVKETQMHLESLFEAEEIFVCNSIIGIWPVKQLEHHHLVVGSYTRQLQILYQHARNQN